MAPPPLDESALWAIYKRLLLWAAGLALLILFVFYAWDVLLLTFAALLFAVILRAFTNWIEAHTRLTPAQSYAVVVIAVVALIGIATWQLAPRVINQVAEILEVIPKSINQLERDLDQYDWGRYISQLATRAIGQMNIGERVTGLLNGLSNAAAALIVVLVVGFYLGLNRRSIEAAS